MLLLLSLLKSSSDEEFERFLKHLSKDEIFNLFLEAKEFINYHSKDFSHKCRKYDDCCLFAILQAKVSEMLNIKADIKFKLLQKKLYQFTNKNSELSKEFFDNLEIKYIGE